MGQVTNMEQLFIRYAFIKSAFDHGEDIFDSFLPLILKLLHDDGFMDCNQVSLLIKNQYKLMIPIHIIETVLKRGDAKQFISKTVDHQKIPQYKISSHGQKYLDGVEPEAAVERRINSLVQAISRYFKEAGSELSNSEVNDLLLSFVANNLESLIESLSLSKQFEVDPKIHFRQRDEILINFINTAEKEKPSEYKTLHDLIFGSVIFTILSSSNQSGLLEIATSSLKDCDIYLDTNFLLSVLELRHNILNEPACELFELLKQRKFIIKVFDFTIDEAIRVLARYRKEGYLYLKSIPVDDICSSLKIKGWSASQLIEYISHLEETIEKQGITIEKSQIALKSYKPKVPEYRELIRKYKRNQDLFSQNHDLAAIEQIERKRGNKKRQMAECRSLFLTSDTNLCRYDYLEIGHKEDKSIMEVMLDRLLTMILWLEQPNSAIPMKSIIASYSGGLFVNRRVWQKFYQVLKNLSINNRITEEEVAILLYQGKIEEILMNVQEDNLDEINDDFALSRIEAIEQTKKQEEDSLKEREREFKEKEREFIETLKQKQEEIDAIEGKVKDEVAADKTIITKTILSNLDRRAAIEAARISLVVRVAVALILVSVPITLFVTGQTILFNNIAGIASILSFVLAAILGSIDALWKKLQEVLKQKIISQKIAETGLKIDKWGNEIT